MVRIGFLFVAMLAVILTAACMAAEPPDQATAAPPLNSPTPTHSRALSPSPTGEPTVSSDLTVAQATPAGQSAPHVCTPLSDVPLPQINDLISNPYHPPTPGSDDPHHGVDLADRLPGSQVAVAGRPVQAVLAGQVAGIILDRFPYGNAIMIETSLEGPADGWWISMQIPTTMPTLAPVSPLTCPHAAVVNIPDPSRRSLYLLYAHLLEPPELTVESPLNCGETIGKVGSSGNALNPHLHFEARVGPAGMRLGSLAHYDNSATPEEMSNYCLWRISGLFQLIDPLQILQYGSQ